MPDKDAGSTLPTSVDVVVAIATAVVVVSA
jgi:hypothetical protein